MAEKVADEPEVFYDAPVAQTESKTEPKQKPERPKKNKQPAPAAPDQAPSAEAIAKAKADVTAAWREQEAIHGISNPTPEMKAEKAKTVALDGWFNPGKFLDDLEKQINQVDRMRICAVSKHGKVFVSSETMMRLIQKQAKSAKIAWLTEMDEYIDLENNKNPDFNKVWAPLMIGIVDLFREQGFIDSCIRPGYYGNYFEVVSEPVPTPGRRFFIVFLANAFKQTIPQLETKKIANRVLNIKEIRLAKSAREV
ncbi:MAG: hypothetical protein ACD_74C00156G0001 [uncultured bacterium]|nr:MAG: hypothetical protein ACD_74C00156G0001 [uncultured bacterium]